MLHHSRRLQAERTIIHYRQLIDPAIWSIGDSQGESAIQLVAAPEPARSRGAIFRPSGLRHAGLSVVLLASVAGLLVCLGTSSLFGVGNLPWVMMAIFSAAAMSSIAGFAFSALCGAMLFHLLGRPMHIVEIMLVCSIAIQLLSVVALKNAIDASHLSRFLIGGIFGLPVGIYLLTHFSQGLYMHCMGAFLILYGVYMLVRRPFVCPYKGALGDCAAGFLGGITGGFAAFPGAFVTIWCGLKGWSKEKQRGIYQPYILIMQLMTLVAIFFTPTARAQSSAINIETLSYIPAALLGTWCGLAIFRRLSDIQFARSLNALLIVSGIGLVS
jgi:uncharacterized membrane protein YfcA